MLVNYKYLICLNMTKLINLLILKKAIVCFNKKINF